VLSSNLGVAKNHAKYFTNNLPKINKVIFNRIVNENFKKKIQISASLKILRINILVKLIL
jgi:hypothetical protein